MKQVHLVLLLILVMRGNAQSLEKWTATLQDSSATTFRGGCTSVFSPAQPGSYALFGGTYIEEQQMGASREIAIPVSQMQKYEKRLPMVRFGAKTDEGYLLYEYNTHQVYSLDKQGNLLTSHELGRNFNGVPFDVYQWGINQGVYHAGKDTLLFFPVLPLDYKKDRLKRKLGTPPGSVALYKLENGKFEIKRLLAPYRGPYGEMMNANYFGYTELASSIDQQTIYLNPIADPGVRAYNLQGDLLFEAGQAGLHAYSEIDRIPEFVQKGPFQNEQSFWLGCTLYRAWTEDLNGKYAYRVYSPGYPLSKIPAPVQDGISFSEEEKTTLNLLRKNRISYLQIYDIQQPERPLIAEVKLPVYGVTEILSADNSLITVLAKEAGSENDARMYELKLTPKPK
jgi:hypothetical protein